MSLTLTLTGTNSVLAVSYFSVLDLKDGEYELGLTNFETYNTIPNITSVNNKFYFDTDKMISIPEGSYELSAMGKYLKAAIIHIRSNNNGNNDDYIFDDYNDDVHKDEVASSYQREHHEKRDQVCLPSRFYQTE
ncbi:hypothetical protein ALC60_13751 [Trachymyrmex zeteki]|uniref:Uncharacterized protein n=1 Tax=Mycetomoellerius zeteki TaxID=64791 RepID=A0A151WH99_9HYME|nr:hypothetical protein ALC60_13751 [Trachymyrmex zeteki]